MADTTVKVDIDVATQAATIALKQFNATIKESDKTFQIFKGNLAAAFTMEGLKKAGEIVFEFGREVINAAAEAEQSLKNLSVALQSAGITSAKSLEELNHYAVELSRVTGFSEDAIRSTEGLIASLTNLDKEGIKKATAAAVDLAATLNIDLDSATQKITSAINGNATALKKQGIIVQTSTDKTQNFANVLDSLSKFQGNAAKSAETYTGAQNKLKEAQNNLYESIGKLVTQNPAVISAMSTVAKIFIGLADSIEKNASNIITFGKALLAATVIVGTIVGVIALMNVSVFALAGAFASLGIAASAAWAAVTSPIVLTIAAIVAVGIAIYAVIKYWDDIVIATKLATAAVLEWGAIAARVFSKDAANGLMAQATALRAQVDASIAAKKAIEDQKKATEEKEKTEEKANVAAKARQDALRAANVENVNFAQELIKQSEDKNKIAQDNLAAIQRNAELETEILKGQLELRQINSEEYNAKKIEIDAELASARNDALDAQYALDLEKLQSALDAEAQTLVQFNKSKGELDRQYADQKDKFEKDEAKKSLQREKDKKRLEDTYRKTSIQATSDVFGAIGEIAALGGAKNFAIAKAFNLASAITAGILAISNAAALPYPTNIPAVISATAFSAVQVARLVATKPSFATGGVVGGIKGASIGGDNTTANVRTGEMILNAKQQKNLFDTANNGSSSNVESLLGQLINATQNQPIIVNVGGRTVVDTIRNELNAGRSFT